MLYLVSEYARQGEIFGKSSSSAHRYTFSLKYRNLVIFFLVYSAHTCRRNGPSRNEFCRQDPGISARASSYLGSKRKLGKRREEKKIRAERLPVYINQPERIYI